MTPSPAVLATCLIIGLAASIEDLWRRRISNITVLAGLAAGLALQIWLRGARHGLQTWAGGAAAGLCVFLIFFLRGGMGGGDVKLMAALGSCVGAAQILRAALLAAIAGALIACLYLLVRWRRRARRQERPPAADETIPYAPAIFAGILLSFLG